MCAILRQQKVLQRLCVRNVGRVRSSVCRSKWFIYSYTNYLTAMLLMSLCYRYLSKLSVYDHSDQAVFVVLGDAGEELTGKKAAELVERYYEVYMKPVCLRDLRTYSYTYMHSDNV